MQNLKRLGLSTILAVSVLPATVSAESWICENSSLVREINVERPADSAVPCSVNYDKGSEGLGTSVLWTAQSDGSYCDAKANGLAEKLGGLGWTCTAY